MEVKTRKMIDMSLSELEASQLKMLLDIFNSGANYNFPDYMKKHASKFSEALEKEGVQ